MGKRSAVRKIRNAEFNTEAYFEDEAQVRSKGLYAIDGGWSPDQEPKGRSSNRKIKEPPRDQSYPSPQNSSNSASQGVRQSPKCRMLQVATSAPYVQFPLPLPL